MIMKVPNRVRSYIVDHNASQGNFRWCGAIQHVLRKALKVTKCIQELKCVIKLLQLLQTFCIEVLATGPIPEHVSFIMDGNRRFAKKSGMETKKGHEAGGLTLLSVCYACKKIGVRCVSAYAFSIENFNRSPEEVDLLLSMFANKLDEFAKRAIDFQDPLYGSRLRVVGDHSLVSEDMRERIRKVEQTTEGADHFTLYICFPYTSRNDIAHAMRDAIEKCVNEKRENESLSALDLTESMYLDGFSNKCDLLIRTSGHVRLSDYMLWQVHENSDIRFTSTLWPDFDFIKLFFLILEWSFFTTIQRYNDRDISLKNHLLAKVPLIKAKKKNMLSIFESLPQPPIAISVTGETD